MASSSRFMLKWCCSTLIAKPTRSTSRNRAAMRNQKPARGIEAVSGCAAAPGGGVPGAGSAGCPGGGPGGGGMASTGAAVPLADAGALAEAGPLADAVLPADAPPLADAAAPLADAGALADVVVFAAWCARAARIKV